MSDLFCPFLPKLIKGRDSEVYSDCDLVALVEHLLKFRLIYQFLASDQEAGRN